MPTVTDTSTGESKEVSMEEFMEAVRNGGKPLGIQQIVTGPDGIKRVNDIYGNMSGSDDGLDRSVNVFCNMQDLAVFVLQIIKGMDEVDNEEDPADKGFVMNVDFMDQPATVVITRSENACKAELFVRDETKSNSPFNLLDSAEWDTPDGMLNMEITEENLSENKMLFFLLGCIGLRKYIKKEGIYGQLKELENKGTGIIVKATEENISTRIVQGRNRPELPCNVFLLGEQMMRPYADEMIGEIMASGMSVEELIAGAEKGDPDCMENLANAYLNGDGAEQDFEKSAYWYEKFAETGNANGQFNLGLYYAKGCGLERDFAKAAEWMRKAAGNGDEDAPTLAVKLEEMAEHLSGALAGDAQAQAELAEEFMWLGDCLDQAGPDKDYAECLKWAQKAAEQGNSRGMWVMALAYHHGRGVEENMETAIEYYKKGAELGNPSCLHNLGCEYMSGENIGKNKKKAFELIKAAAEQGYGLAMRDLGRCYQFAEGCVGNMKTAVEWYEKALEVMDDPELARKVEAFKMLGETDPDWGEDYGGEDSGDEEDDDLPDGVFDVTDIMKKSLAAAGKDADDEAIADMSVEDAYAAFFGDFSEEENQDCHNAMQTLEADCGHVEEQHSSKLAEKIAATKKKFQQTVARIKGTSVSEEDKEISAETSCEEEKNREEAERLAAEKEKLEEEERKRMEAEAAEKKAAEEKARKEAERQNYLDAMSAWETDCMRIRELRSGKLAEKIAGEKDRLEQAAAEKRDAVISEINAEISAETERMEQASATLAALKFFQFKRKKEQEEMMESAQKNLDAARKKQASAEEKYQEEIISSAAEAEKKKASYEQEIDREMPLPAEPEKPEFMKEVE